MHNDVVDRGAESCRIPSVIEKRRIYGGQNTYLPLRVNTGGVIPVIFASSVVMIPTTIAGMVQNEWAQQLSTYISWGQPIYYLLYATAIINRLRIITLNGDRDCIRHVAGRADH